MQLNCYFIKISSWWTFDCTKRHSWGLEVICLAPFYDLWLEVLGSLIQCFCVYRFLTGVYSIYKYNIYYIIFIVYCLLVFPS